MSNSPIFWHVYLILDIVGIYFPPYIYLSIVGSSDHGYSLSVEFARGLSLFGAAVTQKFHKIVCIKHPLNKGKASKYITA